MIKWILTLLIISCSSHSNNVVLEEDMGEAISEKDQYSWEQRSSIEGEEIKELASTDNYDYYQVEEGDTLMYISFKIYGDYLNWRSIKKLNPSVGDQLVTGSKLKYLKPKEKFQWVRNGHSYLIKRGDSLSLIAQDVYGKYQRWSEIFQNNQPMIKDPNLIFAGFTLYYVK